MKKTILTLLLLLSLPAWGQDYCFPDTIEPLIKTRWGQNFPFNILCPKKEVDGETVYNVAGCGPLAMAQIVNYHRYPQMSPDMKYEYDWNLMFNIYEKGRLLKEEIVAVAKLISDCGVSSFTQYNDSNATTNMSHIMGALKRLFLYNNYMCIYNHDEFTTPARDSLYRSMLFSELKAGRPVIVRGSKEKEGGHLFLIDGCKGDKVHANFGWAGSRDGYYRLDDLFGYSQHQWMLIEVADTTHRPQYTEVELKKAGTLRQILTPAAQDTIRHIRLSGDINASDFATLRHMLRYGVLRTIDMEQVKLRQLPDTAFYECQYLSYFVAPRRLEHTGNRTFQRCRNLNNVVFFNKLETVGYAAFSGCANLLNVHLPNSVTSINSNAFTSCEALLNVRLPEYVERVGHYAFSYCKNLYSLYLPKDVEYVGKEVTKECPRLKRVYNMPLNPHRSNKPSN